MFENNHDRTRYILSLMGYSLLKPTNENKKSLETKIYCFQKGHILTLHDKSLDFYSETEKNLFSKIINAISVSKNESLFCFENEKELEKSIQYDNAIAILNFTNRIIQVSDPLISVPPLKSLLNEPSLKSELWQKIKHLRE